MRSRASNDGQVGPTVSRREAFDRLDLRITTTLARTGLPVLRIGLGLVFLCSVP